MSVSHASGPSVLAVAEQLDPPQDVSWSGIRSLVDVLAEVPDPRDPRGVRHSIGAVLSVMVFAVLAGARNFREIADQAVSAIHGVTNRVGRIQVKRQFG